MSNTVEQIKGKAEVISGAIENSVGKAVGNEKMQTKGKAREMKGHARQAVANAVELGKDAVELAKEAAGHAKDIGKDAVADVKAEIHEATKKE